jgi:hypothetical protein
MESSLSQRLHNVGMLTIRDLGGVCTFNALAALQYSCCFFKHVHKCNKQRSGGNFVTFWSTVVSKNTLAHLSAPWRERDRWYEQMSNAGEKYCQ